MDTLALVKLHLALECIGVDADHQLVRIAGPDPDDYTIVEAEKDVTTAALQMRTSCAGDGKHKKGAHHIAGDPPLNHAIICSQSYS